MFHKRAQAIAIFLATSSLTTLKPEPSFCFIEPNTDSTLYLPLPYLSQFSLDNFLKGCLTFFLNVSFIFILGTPPSSKTPCMTSTASYPLSAKKGTFSNLLTLLKIFLNISTSLAYGPPASQLIITALPLSFTTTTTTSLTCDFTFLTSVPLIQLSLYLSPNENPVPSTIYNLMPQPF